MERQAAVAGLPGHVRASDGPKVLRTIRRPGINLVLWQRRLPEAVERRLVTHPTDALPQLRLVTRPSRVAADLAGCMDRLAVVDADTAKWLVADITGLAATLANLCGAARVAIRLEVVEGDACRFFHTDTIALRLATTYRGRGTQWLSQDDAACFGRSASVPDAAIREVDTGVVAVFKGARTVASSAGPLVHRSPPRRIGDDVRLFLAIDPAPS
ncbi:DUF1826 domain-containing protein [Methylobacterium nodulans]|uniref:DUF1826 domain-containing protein n=1 Tax=Methylobacterium nodulans TaxID=114616 RepID=UPI000680D90D|nr:DUF1826 domain-containing protein [Methylobacterium nodulans]